MKSIFFHLMPYRDLPADFETRYESIWVTRRTPSSATRRRSPSTTTGTRQPGHRGPVREAVLGFLDRPAAELPGA
jgi:hypothetical protein